MIEITEIPKKYESDIAEMIYKYLICRLESDFEVIITKKTDLGIDYKKTLGRKWNKKNWN